jgi:hypothetical protein
MANEQVRSEREQEALMSQHSSRREFLKLIPCSAAGLLAGGVTLPQLLAQQPNPPRNPIPPRPIQIQPRPPFQIATPMRTTFNMITLGDSIMWGQGLPESMKFRNLVQNWLQAQFDSTRAVKQWPTQAHSGAQIFVDGSEADTVTNLPGEIPSGHPSIKMQVDLTASDLIRAGIRLSDVDLVLLDGGINDVGILNILLPTNSTGLVKQITDQNCVARMAQLLPRVMGMFTNAAIVITGYFPIASANSDLAALAALTAALGAEAGATVGGGVFGGAAGFVGGAVGKDQMVNNSATWNGEAQSGLMSLVNSTNQQSMGHPRLALAWPDFGPDNCFAAPNSYLFNVAPFNGLAGDEAEGLAGVHEPPPNSVNDVAWTRAHDCVAANRPSPKCNDACMGHPNPLGAQAYANAIIHQLEVTLSSRLGLVENPACASLRTQEGILVGQIASAQAGLASVGKEQQDCEAGIGPAGPSQKPKGCGAAENKATREQLTSTISKDSPQLNAIRRKKSAAACWF